MDIITLSLAVRKALAELGVEIEPGKVIFDETLEYMPTIDAAYHDHTLENDSDIGLVEGNTYSVTTDSGTFFAVCMKYESDIESGLFLGNPGKLGLGNDTGESFFFGVIRSGDEWRVMSIDFNKGACMKVERPETIHPIDPKYLPGVCLPVVELSTVAQGELAPLSTEDAEKMKSLNGKPCMLSVSVNVAMVDEDGETNGTFVRGDITGVANLMKVDGTTLLYSIDASLATVVLMSTSATGEEAGGWSIIAFERKLFA